MLRKVFRGITGSNRQYTWFANAVALLVVTFHMYFGTDGVKSKNYIPNWQILSCLVLCICIGMPHGGMDPVIVWEMVSEDHLAESFIWVVYLSLMGVTFYFWQVDPATSIIVFMCLSVFHFGEGDEQFTRRAPRRKKATVVGTEEEEEENDNCCHQRVVNWLSVAGNVASRGGVFLASTHRYSSEMIQIFSYMISEVDSEGTILSPSSSSSSSSFSSSSSSSPRSSANGISTNTGGAHFSADKVMHVFAFISWMRTIHMAVTIATASSEIRNVYRISCRILRTKTSAEEAKESMKASITFLAEIFCLNLLFMVTPVLMSFTTYFVVFHAMRHCIRVSEFKEGTETKGYQEATSRIEGTTPRQLHDSSSKPRDKDDGRGTSSLCVISVFFAAAAVIPIIAVAVRNTRWGVDSKDGAAVVIGETGIVWGGVDIDEMMRMKGNNATFNAMIEEMVGTARQPGAMKVLPDLRNCISRQEALRSFFIGLSVLHTPHMVIVLLMRLEEYHREKRRRGTSQ